jgi:hypothetical protein
VQWWFGDINSLHDQHGQFVRIAGLMTVQRERIGPG